VLDGVVQLTEKDEFAYHEMVAHVPVFALQNKHPKLDKIRVLLIGAGDGGVLRELLKHDHVAHVTHVEVD
jgi:spermidine synthase